MKNIKFRTFDHTVCLKIETKESSSTLRPTEKDIKKYDSSYRKKKKLFLVLCLIAMAFMPFIPILLAIQINSLVLLSVLISMGMIGGYAIARHLLPLLTTEKEKKYTKKYELLSENENELNASLKNPLIKQENISKIISKSTIKKLEEQPAAKAIQSDRSITYKKLKKLVDYIKSSSNVSQDEEFKRELKK